MAIDYKKYAGRRVVLFLVGGWDCSGILEPFSTEEEYIISNENGFLAVDPSKICAAQIITRDVTPKQAELGNNFRISTTGEAPRSYDQERRLPPGIVAVPSGIKKEDTPLMSKLKSAMSGHETGNSNHYGSIIPADMLIQDDDEEEVQSDFSMNFSPISAPEDKE